MKIYLKSRSGKYDAVGEYDLDTKEVVVLKDSIVSSSVSGGKFRSASAVEKCRLEVCDENGKVLKNISFKSLSTAANFVTGTSTNGMLAWKDKNGNNMKNI